MASEHEPTSAAEPRGGVERATGLSDDVIQALDDSARAAIDALGRFVVTLEEALPEEVKGTSEVSQKITASALEMSQRLIHTQSEFLRKVIDSAGTSLGRSEDES